MVTIYTPLLIQNHTSRLTVQKICNTSLVSLGHESSSSFVSWVIFSNWKSLCAITRNQTHHIGDCQHHKSQSSTQTHILKTNIKNWSMLENYPSTISSYSFQLLPPFNDICALHPPKQKFLGPIVPMSCTEEPRRSCSKPWKSR